MGDRDLPTGRVLIANRGEVVERIARTLARLGFEPLVVYTDADAGLRYVRAGWPAFRLEGAEVADSYANIDALLRVIKDADCYAVHPGYGLLSEHAGFADACRAAGAVFIGPNSGAMKAMATKISAREIATSNGVPVLPAVTLQSEEQAELEAAADKIGFPIAIKPSAAGGGVGMSIVRTPDRLRQAVVTASALGQQYFGDATVYAERYLEHCKHLEVQVAADQGGNVVTFAERDCSLQRRFQKVIEESPSPSLDPATRNAIQDYSARMAKAVGYDSIGTVEFLYDIDRKQLYFLEMNTRLQVEHGLTEFIHGVDLVEWQVRTTFGQSLPTLHPAPVNGHAVEVRIYAEDPQTSFPCPGSIESLQIPEPQSGRIDTAHSPGASVPVYYDPLIAKVISFATERAGAIAQIESVLRTARITGVKTNIPLLLAALTSPLFSAAGYNTGDLERIQTRLGKGHTNR